MSPLMVMIWSLQLLAAVLAVRIDFSLRRPALPLLWFVIALSNNSISLAQACISPKCVCVLENVLQSRRMKGLHMHAHAVIDPYPLIKDKSWRCFWNLKRVFFMRKMWPQQGVFLQKKAHYLEQRCKRGVWMSVRIVRVFPCSCQPLPGSTANGTPSPAPVLLGLVSANQWSELFTGVLHWPGDVSWG